MKNADRIAVMEKLHDLIEDERNALTAAVDAAKNGADHEELDTLRRERESATERTGLQMYKMLRSCDAFEIIIEMMSSRHMIECMSDMAHALLRWYELSNMGNGVITWGEKEEE